MPKHIIPVYEMSATNCGKLAVKLEPAGDFVSMKCEKGQTGYGGETGWTMVTSIVAEDAESTIVVYHDQAGVQTYLERQGPQRMFEDWLDFDVEGSWKSANGAHGYTVSRFFGLFDSVQVPCFAFAHYGGHVARTTGYRHLVSGFYCENTESDQPVSDARIKEMIGKIKTRVF
ncbi:MAG: hypothetical protein ACKVOI_03425 [Dongiaceae bacterium]